MEEKQYISRIKLADGNTVDIKDREARSSLSTIQEEFSEFVQPKSSTEISVADDGALGINEMNINKLVQTEGDVIIIDCGTADV